MKGIFKRIVYIPIMFIYVSILFLGFPFYFPLLLIGNCFKFLLLFLMYGDNIPESKTDPTAFGLEKIIFKMDDLSCYLTVHQYPYKLSTLYVNDIKAKVCQNCGYKKRESD